MLPNSSMAPAKLCQHLETVHLESKDKNKEFFVRKKEQLLESQKNMMHVTQTINEEATEAHYLVSYRTTQAEMPSDKTTPLNVFWCRIRDEYPTLGKMALNIFLPFSRKYLCETGFSTYAATKTKYRNRLDAEPDGVLNFRMAARRASRDCSEVVRYYEGRSVFVTGATGFMGKVLVERLLTACPGIEKIYLLLRQKKDINPEGRLQKLKQSMVFEKLRRSNPTQLDKLVALWGDITEPDLGLTREAISMMDSVSIVFHTAATVKFDEELSLAVKLNILAPMMLMKICKQLPNIEAFIHVSTCYGNCELTEIEEKVYPPPGDLKSLLAACECLSPEMLHELTDKFIGSKPNTYTYTKAMCEHAILQNAGSYPIAIFRPSIVTAALQHPMPGWVDNLNGPTGLIVGAGKGVLRSMHCTRNYVADLIPVDVAIDALICVGYYTATDSIFDEQTSVRVIRVSGHGRPWKLATPKESLFVAAHLRKNRLSDERESTLYCVRSLDVKVYNCSTGLSNPIKWKQIETSMKTVLTSQPLDGAVWYPGGSLKNNKYLDWMCQFLFQTVPAYLIDYTTWLIGVKTRISFISLNKRMATAMSVLTFFATNQWRFRDENYQALKNRLSSADRSVFNLETRSIEWTTYMRNYIDGTRKYVLREKEQDMERAKRRVRWLYFLHYGVKTAVILLFIRLILHRSQTAREIVYGALRVLLTIFGNLSQKLSITS
ncbi:Putative fatty acyl-CoA reductase CG5065 [Eumeta japonica]|uniref:Fatty acyl-CoA reductase n=1 Tax=Eumeta variegata TaxID=151549 RepID=A0A4C1WB90_EUMVA|nr:Putative fatty acyl-CoA reductase CG5065 [Eumeta japonica]